MSFPTVSAEQMREVDRMMVEDLGIQLLQMMENAGRALAHRARDMLGGEAVGRRVTVLAGSGGNGGGGLVAGRRLALWGTEVTVVLGTNDQRIDAVPALQLSILRRVGVPVLGADADLPPAELILDAVRAVGDDRRGRGPLVVGVTLVATVYLVAREADGTVVFVEVQTRSGTGFGGPAEAVDRRKDARLRRLAAAWLATERPSGASEPALRRRGDRAAGRQGTGDDPTAGLLNVGSEVVPCACISVG